MMFIYAESYTSVGNMKPQASHVIVDYQRILMPFLTRP